LLAYYKYGNKKSKFAQHVLEEGHSFGPIRQLLQKIRLKYTVNILYFMVKKVVNKKDHT